MTALEPSLEAARRPVVAVVDYGAGNLVSIEQALARVGATSVRVDRGRDRGLDVSSDAPFDALLVPGVGAAGPAMATLEARDLVAPIVDWIAAGRPYLGVCLGLQLLFERSEEDGARTMGILPGTIARLDGAPRLPHIGWNQVARTADHPLFDGIEPAADFYFVHSYAPRPEPLGANALALTSHGAPFVSAIARGPLLGVQFHPERSGANGLRLLANFVAIVRAFDGAAAGRLAVGAGT